MELTLPSPGSHECVQARGRTRGGKAMGNDSLDPIVKLGNAAVVWQRRTDTSRLRVHTASLSLLPSRRPVRLRLQGPAGSLILKISRVAFWRLTSESVPAMSPPQSNGSRKIRPSWA